MLSFYSRSAQPAQLHFIFPQNRWHSSSDLLRASFVFPILFKMFLGATPTSHFPLLRQNCSSSTYTFNFSLHFFWRKLFHSQMSHLIFSFSERNSPKYSPSFLEIILRQNLLGIYMFSNPLRKSEQQKTTFPKQYQADFRTPPTETGSCNFC